MMNVVQRALRRLRGPLALAGGLVLLGLMLIPLVGWGSRSAPPVRVIGGVADDPSLSWGVHSLEGEWLFVPGVLVDPVALGSSVPGAAVPALVPSALHGTGGSYVVKLAGLVAGQDYGIHLKEVASAYRLYVDGRLVTGRGQVDTEVRGYRAEVGPRMAVFTAKSDQATLVLQWADFTSSVGGLWQPVLVGPAALVQAHFERSLSLDLFFLAALWVLALFHWVQALVLRRDRSTFFLALISTALVAKCAFAETLRGFALFPDLPYETGMELCYLALVLVVPVFFEYARRVFPDDFSQWLVRIWWAPALAEAALVVGTPFAFYQATFWWYQLVLLAAGALMLVLVVRAVVQRRPGAALLLLGLVLLLAAGTNDILYSNGWIQSGYLLNFGLFGFLLCQTTMTAQRFRSALLAAEERHVFEQQSREDPLTGLVNRRQIDDCLDVEFRAFHRYAEPFSVLMIDLDRFKQVNDTFGHLVGDELLSHVARVLTSRLRKTDLCGRFGGDEFLVILRHTAASEARQTAEILRHAVESAAFEHEGAVLPQTISVGVAQAEAEFGDAGSLLEKADQALYRAKNGGRNRVEA